VKSVSRILRKISLTFHNSSFQSQYVNMSSIRRILRPVSYIDFRKGQSCFTYIRARISTTLVRTQSRNCSHAGNSPLEIPGALLRDSFDFRFTGTSLDHRNGSESRACNYYNGRSARRYNLIWFILLWNADGTCDDGGGDDDDDDDDEVLPLVWSMENAIVYRCLLYVVFPLSTRDWTI